MKLDVEEKNSTSRWASDGDCNECQRAQPTVPFDDVKIIFDFVVRAVKTRILQRV